MTKWHGGKGDGPRKSDDAKQYADNWEKIFGNKKQVKQDGNDSSKQEVQKEHD